MEVIPSGNVGKCNATSRRFSPSGFTLTASPLPSRPSFPPRGEGFYERVPVIMSKGHFDILAPPQQCHLSLFLQTGERPFRCAECDRSFAQRSNLVSHTRAVHVHGSSSSSSQGTSSSRPHGCPLQGCGVAFTRKAHLAAHLAAHSGERPHSCVTCRAGECSGLVSIRATQSEIFFRLITYFHLSK